jgi:hypothetical protein
MADISKRLSEIQKIVNEKNLAKVAFDEFKKNTPVKTGNARRSTTLSGNEILADYPYAGVLDQGRGFRDGQMRGSTQAPRGMTEPTLKFLLDYIKKKVK